MHRGMLRRRFLMMAAAVSGEAAPTDVKRDYLLTMDDYSTDATLGYAGVFGREFYVKQQARCYGVRIKHPYTTTGLSIRLYRVEDHAVLAQKDGMSATAGETTELLFDGPIALEIGAMYRVARYESGATNIYRRDSEDAQTSDVLCFTYRGSVSTTGVAVDAYPLINAPTTSMAIEPIIYTTSETPDAVPSVTPMQDTFSGSGALSGRAPDTVGAAWAVLNGQFGNISSGRATYLNAADGDYGVAVVDCGSGNCEIISTHNGGNLKAGIACRSSATGVTRLLMVPYTGLSRIYLYRTSALETLAEVGFLGSVTWTAGDDHAVTVLCREHVIRVLVDGAVVGAFCVSPSLAANDCHGLGTYGRAFNDTEISWDSIQVQALTGWEQFAVIGDSISSATNTSDDLVEWPQLVAAGRNSGRVWPYNHAVAQAHIVSGIGHMSQQVAELAYYDLDYIIILMGTNDVATIGSNEAAYEADLLQLHADHPSVPIYACTILNCTTMTSEQRTSINTEIASAVTDAAAAGVNVTLWDTDGWIDPATDTSDGLHPNAAGHTKIAAAMEALLSA